MVMVQRFPEKLADWKCEFLVMGGRHSNQSYEDESSNLFLLASFKIA